MAEIVTMPKMSDTMTEGVIASWHKKIGDTVESGELMAEIETDKATMEYESYHDGVVLYLGGQEGDAIAVDGVLAVVGKKGEDYQALIDGATSGASGGSQADDAPAVAEKSSPSSSESIDTSGIKAEIVRMPKMSDTMTDGVIAAWHKKVGDTVSSGELVAEIETDKATMEYESFEEGTILYLGADAGGSVAVDGVLSIVGEPGADWETLLKAENAQTSAEPAAVEPKQDAPAAAPVKKEAPTSEASSAPVVSNDGSVKASPLARSLAKEKGFDVSQIAGSGPNGRVIKTDVENFTPTTTAPAQGGVALPSVLGQESFEEVRVSQMRKTIAKRLSESKFSAPHFYLTMEINMDNAITARKSMNEVSPVKISFNDMVIKAVAASLKQHPGVNSSWLEDKIRINHHVNIGVAVAVEDGLLVPVVRFADGKSLSHISQEVKMLAGKAKNKELQPKDWEGSTFTISNLGMFGIEQFTAIVNPPDACIMAIGGIKQVPVVKDGQVVPGNIMKVTLSCDHRAVDGAVGSAFLQTFKGLLEDPVRILI